MSRLLLVVLIITLAAVGSTPVVRDGPEPPPDPEDESALDDDLDEDYKELNVTAEKSKYLGSPCDFTCNPMLAHVFCNPETRFCECEKSYPVHLGPTKGCAKPKKLGEQCLYQATCTFTDQHSVCKQVQHNAVCECEFGYHRVPLSRTNKKLFCAADLVLIATDLPTLLWVASGIAVFTGAICFTLQLFSRARYTRPRRYANSGQTGAMLFSTETGIPLTLHQHHRPASRSSQRGSLNYTRKPSLAVAAGSGEAGNNTRIAGGSLVPASRAGAARAAAILLISCGQQSQESNGNNHSKHRRALSDVVEVSSDGLGSRRPSVASIHSSTSSAKSYSARRFERERGEKEHRAALIELKLKQNQPPVPIVIPAPPTPSPIRTPHSTDELLPSVDEGTEIFPLELIATNSGAMMVTAIDKASSSKFTTTLAQMNDDVMSPLFEIDAKPSTSSASS